MEIRNPQGHERVCRSNSRRVGGADVRVPAWWPLDRRRAAALVVALAAALVAATAVALVVLVALVASVAALVALVA